VLPDRRPQCLMHEVSTPDDRDPPQTREREVPNDEDGRVVQSVAEIPTIEFQAARMAPSGTTPAVTNRQIAMSSLRAIAMIAIRRVRP
jgi:hypothetical protein